MYSYEELEEAEQVLDLPEPTPLPDDWRLRAACFVDSTDPAVISERWALLYDDPLKAKGQFCAHCPVRRECLDHAIEVREEFGVWGGLTKDQRDRIVTLREAEPAHAGIACRCQGPGCENVTVVTSGSWPYCSLVCGSKASRRIR